MNSQHNSQVSKVGTFDPSDRNVDESAKIRLTSAAVAHVKKAIAKRGSGIGIRFGTKKSGCSGYAYVVDFIDKSADDDYVFPVEEGLAVYVDPKSFPFIKGTRLDYVKEGINQVFKFNNPNETGGCGCGESFTVEE